MNTFPRKILAGFFLWVFFGPQTFAQTSLAKQLWDELEVAKTPVLKEASSEAPETPPPTEELSPADLAFMEGELQEDSVSTGMAAPVRKETQVTSQNKTVIRKRSRAPTLKRHSFPQVNENPAFVPKSEIRERSR